ncbi:hypothetical protein [Neorhizobium sp. NCHU2750]|uniref:hypothetical protein n=1 Tax=Neorhizobium sp. NCHU2750 TaxID=1825976 RepID=UPI0013C523ED
MQEKIARTIAWLSFVAAGKAKSTGRAIPVDETAVGIGALHIDLQADALPDERVRTDIG